MSDFNLVQEKPEVFSVDARKCKSLEEMGLLINALGIAMTKEFAAENNIEHLLQDEMQFDLPNLEK